MIVPSIDIQGGRTVQLVGGEDLALEAGDPCAVAERMRLAGEIAVVDLDAARGSGSNRALVERLCAVADCRVGGGLRDRASVLRALDAGATRVVLGTAAEPALLASLPRERVIVALDARDGEVVVEGWRKRTGRALLERVRELAPLCSGFLVTFVEREGRLAGTDMTLAREVIAAAQPSRVTIAGGITSPAEIAELDRLGADAQVGMALYTGRLHLADALAAPLTSDRSDGLFPTVVVDESGFALGLAWSSGESLRAAIDARAGIYHSRKRGLWRKGESSGATQELLRVSLDCDRDALRFVVRQHGEGFCHTGSRTCFGEDFGLARLARRLAARVGASEGESYTARLAADPKLLEQKLFEEARELVLAENPQAAVHELADVLYFALVQGLVHGAGWEAVSRELARRERPVTRRGGEAKPARATDEEREARR